MNKEEIKKLALLARIQLSEDELESLAKEANSILEYVSQVQNISPTERERGSTEPSTANVHNVMRDDIVTHTPEEYTEKILSLAPSRQDRYLKVKKILQF